MLGLFYQTKQNYVSSIAHSVNHLNQTWSQSNHIWFFLSIDLPVDISIGMLYIDSYSLMMPDMKIFKN